jgi:O-antigen/teichoic acid export membrane protein
VNLHHAIKRCLQPQKLKASFTFAGFEAINQVLMLVVGLIVVRNMLNAEYGYYTICIATIGICNSLANSGLSSGFRKIGGEVHENRGDFSTLYVSAVRERQFQSWFVIPASIGIAFFFLYRLEGLWLKSLLLSLLVGLNALPELWRSISVEVLLLKSAWRTVQMQNLWSVLLRLVLIASLLAFGLSAGNMLLVNAAALWGVGWATFRAAKAKLRLPAPESDEQRREIRQIMNRVLPNACFSVGQQQLGTFLLASRGTVTAVADLGALTRLTAIFGIGVSAVAQIVAPKFARTHNAAAIQRLYWGTLAFVGLIAVVVLAVTWFFPAQLLWLLGPKYEHLQGPLLLAVVLTMLQVTKAVTMRMNQAKAWILRTARWNILLTLAAIGCGLAVFDTRTLEGVLALMLLSSLPMLSLYLVDAIAGLRACGCRKMTARST